MSLGLALLLAILIQGPALADPQVIRPGNEGLDGSKLEPFEARYELIFGGEVQGHRRIHLQEAKTSGEDGMRFTKTMERGETMVDEVQFVRASQRPVTHNVVSVDTAHHISIWDGNKIQGFRIEADGSAAEKVELESDGERFAGTQFPLMLVSMSLTQGDEIEIPMIVSMFGAERANVTASLVVKGREEIEAKTGQKYSTWVIESQLLDGEGNPVRPPSTFWLADEAPYMIRSDTGGGRMLLELVEVR